MEVKESLKGQIETILREFMTIYTELPIVLKENENNDKVGFPRIEFEVLEINLNQEIMTISVENNDIDKTIIDNYNRTSRYMLDFVLIHKPDNEGHIDKLIKVLTNYYKLDRYFNYFDYSQYDVEDITINHDFKPTNRGMFYLDQSIKRDGYSFTLDVETIDKDIIPMGVYMKRGEFIE